MAQYYYPTQNRYNDPYQQRITPPGSVYREKYLSRASNNIVKAFGDNIIISGLEVTPSFLGSVITLQLTPGIVIHDSTVIAITSTTTLDCDVVTFADTPTGNAHLAIFTDFQYLEPNDPAVQTPLKITVYYINSSGTPVAFGTSPAFSVDRNKILVAVIDFTKSGSNVISCSQYSVSLTNSFTISGTDYYIKGITESNINFYDIYNNLIDEFLAEFLFHDNLRG